MDWNIYASQSSINLLVAIIFWKVHQIMVAIYIILNQLIIPPRPPEQSETQKSQSGT